MKKYITIFALSSFWHIQTMGMYQNLLSTIYRLQSMVGYTTKLHSLQKEYHQLENKYNKKFTRALKNTNYHKITPLCAYLLKNNYYIREKYMPEKNFYSIKDRVSLLTFGQYHFEKRKKEIDFFDTLLEMKCDILDTTHKQIYNESYYKQKEELQNKINFFQKSPLKAQAEINTDSEL